MLNNNTKFTLIAYFQLIVSNFEIYLDHERILNLGACQIQYRHYTGKLGPFYSRFCLHVKIAFTVAFLLIF